MPPRSQKVVLMIGANWCPYCRKIKPTFQKESRKYAPKIKSLFIDSQSPEADAFTFQTIPTFVFLHNGKKIYQYSSSEPKLLENAFKAFDLIKK